MPRPSSKLKMVRFTRSVAARTVNKGKFRLLDLPAELRNHIYGYALADLGIIDLAMRFDKAPQSRASQQSRAVGRAEQFLITTTPLHHLSKHYTSQQPFKAITHGLGMEADEDSNSSDLDLGPAPKDPYPGKAFKGNHEIHMAFYTGLEDEDFNSSDIDSGPPPADPYTAAGARSVAALLKRTRRRSLYRVEKGHEEPTSSWHGT
ncbi:hypothetical protein LTR66_002999 [Elasticomyces elasticus]|nr:hypothetical protein LTR66_002999 [Elasticomyces elasticus]